MYCTHNCGLLAIFIKILIDNLRPGYIIRNMNVWVLASELHLPVTYKKLYVFLIFSSVILFTCEISTTVLENHGGHESGCLKVTLCLCVTDGKVRDADRPGGPGTDSNLLFWSYKIKKEKKETFKARGKRKRKNKVWERIFFMIVQLKLAPAICSLHDLITRSTFGKHEQLTFEKFC